MTQLQTPGSNLLWTEDLQAAARAFTSNVNDLHDDSPTRLGLHRLLIGPNSDRHTAALLIGRRADPADLPLVSALLGDADPEVRDTAAEIVGDWVVKHPQTETAVIDYLINTIIKDPGTSAARRLTTSLTRPDAVVTLDRHRDALIRHPSARVRHRASD